MGGGYLSQFQDHSLETEAADLNTEGELGRASHPELPLILQESPD